jgi:hypothetical protein
MNEARNPEARDILRPTAALEPGFSADDLSLS